ncbi:MAG TPA: DUF5658 family protein [Bryobacteraceae bacterium]|nr:DUF5658 family protein [Bryobacteraceae bacterium]
MTIFQGEGMLYTEVFLYLQVLDLLTTLIGFKLGLMEASPFIRALLRFGPVAALVLSKALALVLAGACVTLHKQRLIRWISYWFAGLIAWNLCTILTAGRCR